MKIISPTGVSEKGEPLVVNFILESPADFLLMQATTMLFTGIEASFTMESLPLNTPLLLTLSDGPDVSITITRARVNNEFCFSLN